MKIYYVVIDKINNLLRYLAKTGFLKNAAKLAGVTAISQVVLVLSSLILTRLYTPEDFGMLAVFTSLMSQILVFASLRYEWAIPLPKDEQIAVDLLVLCIILNCGIALLSVIVIILGGHQIALWSNSPALEPFLWLLPIVVLFGGCYQSFNYWSLRQKAFGLLAQTKLSQTVWTTGSQLSIGFITDGPLGLLVGAALNQMVGTGTQALFFWRNCRTQLQNLSVNRLIQVSRKHCKFATSSLGASVVQTAGLTVPALLIAFFYDARAVGSFALAERVISLPVALVGRSIAQVFLAHASELIRENPKELKRLFSRTTALLFLISSLFSLGLLLSPWIFPIVFGNSWKEAGNMTLYMIPMFVASITISPVNILAWVEKQNWMITWNVVRLALLSLGFWLANISNLSSTIAVAIWSLITAIMYILLLILNFYSIHLLAMKHSK